MSRDYTNIVPGNTGVTSGFSPARVDPVNGSETRPHKGEDIGAPSGSDVKSPADGSVVRNGYQENGYGNYVVIQHVLPDGTVVETVYAHLKNRSGLEEGKSVSAGDTVGLVGSTGSSTGPHLHYEERGFPSNVKPDASGNYPWNKGLPKDPATDPFGLSKGGPGNTGNDGTWPRDRLPPLPSSISEPLDRLRDLKRGISEKGRLCSPKDIGDLYGPSRTAIPIPVRYDPLVLDLDGDGIESVGIDAANPILFDHAGSGIKTATGWVKSDDAYLVLDHNGNGSIDSGAELFSDATPLDAGGIAADGFAALAQEDSNGDGAISAADARWAELRLWRDLNQDGLAQNDERFTVLGHWAGNLCLATPATRMTILGAKTPLDQNPKHIRSKTLQAQRVGMSNHRHLNRGWK